MYKPIGDITATMPIFYTVKGHSPTVFGSIFFTYKYNLPLVVNKSLLVFLIKYKLEALG